jgi:hypothetical protein
MEYRIDIFNLQEECRINNSTTDMEYRIDIFNIESEHRILSSNRELEHRRYIFNIESEDRRYIFNIESEDRIKTIKEAKYSDVESNEDCQVCYIMNVNVKYNSCGHELCKDCMNRWGVINKTCPFCRTSVF